MSDHDALVDRLRDAAAQADPHPAELEDSARAAFGLHRFDLELAELLHDSADELAGVRGGDDSPRLVSFGSGDVGAEVQISHADGLAVTGLVTGAVTGAHLQTPTVRHELTLDPHGRFRLSGIHDAPAIRLELVTGSGYTVVTPWVMVA